MLTRTRIRSIVTGSALAVAMAALPLAANASTSATPAQVGKCTPSTLRLSFGPAHGAAGSVTQSLRFTNVGTTACGMVGFPGISYVNGDAGNQVGAPAQRSGPFAPWFVLQPGQVAHADIAYTVTQNFPPATCSPTHVRGIRVYPPNDYSAMYIPRPGTGCGNSAVTQLQVQSTEPGPGR